jgi:hypothetical protein
MLEFVFRKINIGQLAGESGIGAKEILGVPAFHLAILDRSHACIGRQFHANIIALVKQNPSIERVLNSILPLHFSAHAT